MVSLVRCVSSTINEHKHEAHVTVLVSKIDVNYTKIKVGSQARYCTPEILATQEVDTGGPRV